jgi:hypothetical protein
VIYRYRVAFTLAGLAIAAGAAASVSWQRWVPVTACLLCDAHTPAPSAAATGPGSGPIAGGGPSSYAGSSTGTSGAGALPPASIGGEETSRSGGGPRNGSAHHGWQPWGPSTGTLRVSSSSGSGPSAPLGGLWRMMNMARSVHTGSSGATTHIASVHTTTPKQAPAPRAPGTRRPSPGHGSASPAPSLSASPAVGTITAAEPSGPSGDAPSIGAAPTDPFHEHESPAPDPFGGDGHDGGFDPGTPGGGGHVPSGGGVSPTPEPGSVLLIGTGLLGILGVLRRRRLI